MTSDLDENWICCQIGAREHYAIPRALHRRGVLELLLTDLWVPPGHPLRTIRPSLSQRFHPELENARVISGNLRSIALELQNRIKGRHGWPGIIHRNNWFQEWAARQLQSIPEDGRQRVLFAYSYAARRQFQVARRRGWQTILGQIDPGPRHEEIVAEEVKTHPTVRTDWKPAPQDYWRAWSQEYELADVVVVNSQWSRRCLLAAGVPAGKMQVIPLAYEPPTDPPLSPKTYPTQFTNDRPLRVLFVGQLSPGKGASRLLQVAEAMKGDPVEFWFVGRGENPHRASNDRVKGFGHVSHDKVAKFYKDADVLIVPTLSDGFALTQLEALSYRLPVIASRFCGDVVRDGVDGIVLPEITPNAISERLREVMIDSSVLNRFSTESCVRPEFGLAAISQLLSGVRRSTTMSS
jgi:glycosyltransferase involved in cell wall biosynthesis